MKGPDPISWLLEGDVSIQYQTYRDLLGIDNSKLRNKIQKEGWGRQLLSAQNDNGEWGNSYYQPKWTCSHYTLLDLKNLYVPPANKQIRLALNQIFASYKGTDGGINPSGTISKSDVCINGMVLNFSSYFRISQEKLTSIVDFLLGQQMPDGGFNCHSNRKGARHSSLHSTLSVLEGVYEYQNSGYTYRSSEIRKVEAESREFILAHKLCLSDRTGKIINKHFLKLCYPCRWYYDILKALDYFQSAKVKYDERMKPAIDFLLSKQNKNKQWKLAAKHPGKTHVEMEKAGAPSRWNTMRASRVLKYYKEFLTLP